MLYVRRSATRFELASRNVRETEKSYTFVKFAIKCNAISDSTDATAISFVLFRRCLYESEVSYYGAVVSQQEQSTVMARSRDASSTRSSCKTRDQRTPFIQAAFESEFPAEILRRLHPIARPRTRSSA